MDTKDTFSKVSGKAGAICRKMRMLATGSVSLVLLYTAIASCTHRQEAMLSSRDSLSSNTDTLRIAVMPTISCLPVFYALRTGIPDSMGLDLKLLRYNAQADVDTAVAYGHTDVAWTDLIRAIRQYPLARPFLSTDEEVSLIAHRSKRAKSLAQMKEQMVAVSRLSITDYWCDRMMDSAKMEYDQLFRPQINDVRLRADMMRTGLLEGAMMCDPYSSWMAADAGRRLFRSRNGKPKLGTWVVSDSLCGNAAMDDKLRLFHSMLSMSVERMNSGEESDCVRRILAEEYGFPSAVADSVRLAPIAPPSRVNGNDVDSAVVWLRGRKALPSGFRKEEFIYNVK